MSYTSYDHDRLEAAEKLKIERTIYFQSEKSDIAELTALPLAELIRQKEESAAAEENIYSSLREQATAWEEQAGKTLSLEKAIEYARTPAVQHTSNKWQERDHDRREISNAVYRMNYYVYENTRYDREKKESVPYSYSLTWNVYTNGPERNRQMKIAGQDRKVFADRAAMEKYLAGRQKAYANLFTEVSPQIPKQYAECFKVNGVLLPGYTIEGEERGKPEQAPAEQRTTTESKDEQFAILLDSRSRFETGEAGGYWLSMPATKEQLQEALAGIGLTADKPQDLFIRGFSDTEEKPLALPYDMVCSANIDELNFLAARLENLDASGVAALNAAAQRKQGFENVGQIIDFTYNEDFFVHIPEVRTPAELGNYYLNKSGMVQMPDEWKAGVDLAAFGQNAAEKEKGSFTDYGYILESGDDWVKHYEGREVPEEYRIMSSAQAPQIDPAKVDMDISAVQTAEQINVQTKEPQPVIPIILTSENPAGKLKEITDRLEQGITELFNSERFKEYLQVMSKFHNYSFNNTLLIAMQKPDASHIVGFSAWKNTFKRNVMKGQKGIKILAPSPYTVKKEIEKIDPLTQKPVIGKDGKPVTEEKEITIPAFKVVSVFDVSQTEGREIPDIAVNMLTGDVEHYKDVFAALEKTSPVPVGFEKIEGGAHGYYHLEDKRIALDEGMSELQTLKTLIHEIAHAKLHDIDLNAPLEDLENRPDRRTREVQAESIAYTVCQHYGLDTSDYSFGYVAGWSAGRELAELKSSLETIRSTAAEIINSIDEHIAELQKEQAQDAPREKAAMPEYIYKIEANPRTTGDNDRFFLQAYLPQENGRAKIGDVLYIGSLAKCRELMGGLNAGELTQGEVKELYAKAQEAEADKDTFSIYQLKQGDETRDFRFEPYDRLQAAGNVVDKANYELVYSAELTPGTSLEDIYTRFNIDHPKDFKGHSLSVSDVVVLHQNGQDAAHYVDSFGYKEVPEFLQEQTQQPEKINPLKHVEDTIEQNDNSFDGIINNTPTVDELEAKVKAGEQISLVDLAEAIKADKECGKEKPSIRAQLKADKERAGKKKNAKQKSQDLERS
ncbi:YodL domain-containing protein [Hominenteromicrobium sp.]|uniref:YodL domain-containing protein n=1 Tax=Hominenteromicrobium sp. TaxID=3073581 RepID=UPI003A8E5DA2